MQFRHRRRRSASILDMSPLIDCVFLLLIFFLLSSSFASPKIEVTPPALDGAPRDLTESTAPRVSASSEGAVWIDGVETSLADLEERLRQVLAGRSDRRITFEGAEGLPYDIFLRVLHSAKKAGCGPVDLAAREARLGKEE